MISLVDCHAHLHDPGFDSDRTEVLARAAAAGVSAIITAGTDVATSAAAVALAEHEPSVWATVGIHPHEAAVTTSEDLIRLEALAGSERVVAIGEIGLDYHYDHSPHAIQRARFEEQLELAGELGLPVVVHSRDADEDTFDILASWSSRQKARAAVPPFGLMHCYSYGRDRIDAYQSLEFFLSVPGIVTYPKADLSQGAAAAIDLDSLVIETDCPYLAPQSRRGRRNEPYLVRETAIKVAELRAIPLDEFSARTTANARRLFRLSESDSILHVAGDKTGQVRQ